MSACFCPPSFSARWLAWMHYSFICLQLSPDQSINCRTALCYCMLWNQSGHRLYSVQYCWYTRMVFTFWLSTKYSVNAKSSGNPSGYNYGMVMTIRTEQAFFGEYCALSGPPASQSQSLPAAAAPWLAGPCSLSDLVLLVTAFLPSRFPEFPVPPWQRRRPPPKFLFIALLSAVLWT